MSDTELKLVQEELRRLENLVRVRALLEDRGASVTVIREHAAVIERLREQLAQHVRETTA